MKITWFGLACFRIDGNEVSIVTDPYQSPGFGMRAIPEPADIVIRSSPDDNAHASHEMVPGRHELIDALDVAQSGPKTVHGVTFEAFRTRERLVREKPDPSENAMYRFTLDGLRVFHFGDVGHAIQPDHLDRLRDQVDVMLAVTGDNYTIPIDDVVWAIDKIKPRVVIPMHYQAGNLALPRGYWMYPVEAFLTRYPEDRIVRDGSPSVEITAATLPAEFQIRVLESAG